MQFALTVAAVMVGTIDDMPPLLELPLVDALEVEVEVEVEAEDEDVEVDPVEVEALDVPGLLPPVS